MSLRIRDAAWVAKLRMRMLCGMWCREGVVAVLFLMGLDGMAIR
jgi:hypothetical protein